MAVLAPPEDHRVPATVQPPPPAGASRADRVLEGPPPKPKALVPARCHAIEAAAGTAVVAGGTAVVTGTAGWVTGALPDGVVLVDVLAAGPLVVARPWVVVVVARRGVARVVVVGVVTW